MEVKQFRVDVVFLTWTLHVGGRFLGSFGGFRVARRREQPIPFKFGRPHQLTTHKQSSSSILYVLTGCATRTDHSTRKGGFASFLVDVSITYGPLTHFPTIAMLSVLE